ncbi:MAG: DUF1844 domain-containing protein [Bdellovibrionota bacterium]|nr:DUF1844 domain-containing protein [Bdellovibrionota bacterium]
MSQPMQADFSSLVMSIGSAAMMGLGDIANPQTGKNEKNKEMAKFNIDLLEVLRDKTKNNLSSEEQNLLDRLVSDLKMRYVNS